MKILTKIARILFPFVFIPFLCIAQYRDSLKSVTADSTSAVVDTTPVKDWHLQTAGKALKTTVLSVPGDFVQMGKVLTRDWRVTAACVGGISLMILADKPITQWYQDHVETTIKYKLPKLPGANGNRFFYGNDAYLNYAILGLYGGSLAANYKTGQMAALNSMKALAYSYLITQVTLKSVFGRNRPDPKLSDGKPAKSGYTNDPYDFFNSHRVRFNAGGNIRGMSFPSMHATAYFAVAKVMAMEFHNYWIPYGTVAFIFLADVDAHQHWVGDMVAGGLLGTVIGQGIVMSSRLFEKRQEEKKIFGGNDAKRPKSSFNYQILPAISSHMTGVTFFVSL